MMFELTLWSLKKGRRDFWCSKQEKTEQETKRASAWESVPGDQQKSKHHLILKEKQRNDLQDFIVTQRMILIHVEYKT